MIIKYQLPITTKTTKSKDKVRTKLTFLSTKFSTKKFYLVSKYANYPNWDEKQNAPTNLQI